MPGPGHQPTSSISNWLPQTRRSSGRISPETDCHQDSRDWEEHHQGDHEGNRQGPDGKNRQFHAREPGLLDWLIWRRQRAKPDCKDGSVDEAQHAKRVAHGNSQPWLRRVIHGL
jgi:hypothetical protein